MRRWHRAGRRLVASPHTMPAWQFMWTIACGEFAAVKLLSLAAVSRPWRRTPRLAAYLALWPGMNAPSFLDPRARPTETSAAEWASACLKAMLGAALTLWAVEHSETYQPLAAGWIGMLGMILLLHFGLFHLLSCAWRRAGVAAPPLMRAPLAAKAIAEFWSERWNTAFAEVARRHVFRPLARRHGTSLAGVATFAISGLIHESVISLPARAGWGGPTIYFLLQAAGLGVQRHRAVRRTWLTTPLRDRLWTIVVIAVPVPLLFHRPFVEGVITPFLRQLDLWLP